MLLGHLHTAPSLASMAKKLFRDVLWAKTGSFSTEVSVYVYSLCLPLKLSFYPWYSAISLQYFQMQTFVYIASHSITPSNLRLASSFFIFGKFSAAVLLNILLHLLSLELPSESLELSSEECNDCSTFSISSRLCIALWLNSSVLFSISQVRSLCPMNIYCPCPCVLCPGHRFDHKSVFYNVMASHLIFIS